ncbi:MAG: response regulator [Thermoguttaceae bacterium]|nr:response regulator [Thermoguttaceae bacterium]MDW8077550.1 response regulator [Thermoguttaceae bacterium]
MANRTPPKTVLIADDSLLMRRMIGEILSSSGWQIVGEAANGQEAIDAYFRLRPAVVTMDIVMPEMDGLFALQRILERDPKARVVVVSALSQTKLISEAIRRGAFDFVAKPFLPEQLRETVERCYEAAFAAC